MHYVNYNSLIVPFPYLEQGGVDNAIRLSMPIFSKAELELFYKLIKPRSCSWDLGAYIGTSSILFALLGAEVHAFEPSLRNYSRCVAHCAPLRQITVHNVALHEKQYTVKTRFKDCNNQNSEDPEQEINYVILPDYAKQKKLPPPDFIKMDIEGMETTVFKTLDEILLAARPSLFVETHPRPRESTHQVYENNPHWEYADEGGFDWNCLKHFYYNFYQFTESGLKFVSDVKDYNEYVNTSIVLIPKEKDED